MIDEATTARFDRRSLIKKGLVAGGVAATVPVITTFNAAAFAASVPGCHREQYLIQGNLNQTITAAAQTPTVSGTCDPSGGGCTWASPTTPLVDPPTTASINQTTNVVTFTLTGDYASCEIVAATAQRTTGAAGCETITTGIGTNTVSWEKPDGQDWVVRLLISC
jgi:hypothetical protein